MKKYILILFLASLLNACKEDGPFIDFTAPRAAVQGDTAFIDSVVATPQLHNVLLEDITGVKCVNCPKAHDEAKTIRNNNPGRIVVLGLHAWAYGQFTNATIPPGYGYPDFRDSASDYIAVQLLGNPNGLPAGAVDRKLYPGEAARNMTYSKWNGYVGSELTLPTPMNLDITNSYNPVTREVTSVVKMECTQNVSDTVYLSVGIKESDILGTQLSTPDTIQNYHHNDVLRTLITPYAGLKLNSPTINLNQKQVVVRVFKYNLPAKWNENNCTVFGILHKSSARIDVIHCAEKKIL